MHVEFSKGAGHAATVPRPNAVTARDRCVTPEPQASVQLDQVLQNDLFIHLSLQGRLCCTYTNNNTYELTCAHTCARAYARLRIAAARAPARARGWVETHAHGAVGAADGAARQRLCGWSAIRAAGLRRLHHCARAQAPSVHARTCWVDRGRQMSLQSTLGSTLKVEPKALWTRLAC